MLWFFSNYQYRVLVVLPTLIGILAFPIAAALGGVVLFDEPVASILFFVIFPGWLWYMYWFICGGGAGPAHKYAEQNAEQMKSEMIRLISEAPFAHRATLLHRSYPVKSHPRSDGSCREICDNELTHSAVLPCIAGHIAVVSPFQSWVNELYSVTPESLGRWEKVAR